MAAGETQVGQPGGKECWIQAGAGVPPVRVGIPPFRGGGGWLCGRSTLLIKGKGYGTKISLHAT